MSYLYQHVRLDTNQVFYIGIGSDQNGQHLRAYDKGSRNIIWNRIVKKTEYRVEIIADNISWEHACLFEKKFIDFYGRKNLKRGPLCNLTDGGDGSHGYIATKETRKKLSEAAKNKVFSEEHRNKLKLASTGKNLSESSKKKISNANKGNIPWNKGKKNVYSDEVRKSMGRSGEQHPKFGKGKKIKIKNGI